MKQKNHCCGAIEPAHGCLGAMTLHAVLHQCCMDFLNIMKTSLVLFRIPPMLLP